MSRRKKNKRTSQPVVALLPDDVEDSQNDAAPQTHDAANSPNVLDDAVTNMRIDDAVAPAVPAVPAVLVPPVVPPLVAPRVEVVQQETITPYHESPPREPIWRRLRSFMHSVQVMLKPNGKAASASALSDDASAEAQMPSPVNADQGLKSQITDADRAHLEAFPAERKAEIMNKIMSLTPVYNVVHQGGNQFEKAVLRMHREGYQLIDMQPHETAFTTVWYRKDRSILNKKSDIVMLLWEDGEVVDSTTIMNWRI